MIRPTRATIDLDAIAHNLALLRRLTGTAELCAVVKADAYGHGAVPVARHLARLGVGCFGVALVEEGVALREAGITQPILVWGGALSGGYEALVAHGLTPVVAQPEHVHGLAAALGGRPWAVHVEVDTGMARLGATMADLPALIRALRAVPIIDVQGIMSHLAVADVADHAFNEEQLQRLRAAEDLLAAAGIRPTTVHVANSPATVSLPGAHRSLVRCGLALYGIEPMANRPTPNLRPALTLTTQVVALRALPAGAPVSYGCRWRATRPSTVATLPIGYADGYPRAVSSRAMVLVGGERVPQVGTVCMDLSMVDVTDRPTTRLGDEVVLVGRQGDAHLGVDELARWANTISYEVLCGLSKRVPRVYVGA